MFLFSQLVVVVFFQLKLAKIYKMIKPNADEDVVRWALGSYLEGGGVNCFLENKGGFISSEK